jgi:hypothetical protein
MKARYGAGAKGSGQTVGIDETTGDRMKATMPADKPFQIDKKRVYEAYKAVRSNHGAAGVDGQSLAAFEKDLRGNLYKIWNRMSSGSYFPPPVRAVSIPKKGGDGERILGVPTVGDRIAEMVVKQLIEPDLEPIFLPDSYGGYVAVAVLIASGSINSWFLIGPLPHLIDTSYGQLLLSKLGLFGLMLFFALSNRLWLLPAIAQSKTETGSERLLARLRRGAGAGLSHRGHRQRVGNAIPRGQIIGLVAIRNLKSPTCPSC